MVRAVLRTICPSTTWSPSPRQRSHQGRSGEAVRKADSKEGSWNAAPWDRPHRPRSGDSRGLVFPKMPGSLAGFCQEFITEAAFDRRLTLFLGCKTTSDGKYDPKYPAALPSRSKRIGPFKVHRIPEKPFSWPVWITTRYGEPPVLSQLTKVWYPGITDFKTFSSKQRNTHGLHYSRTLYSLSPRFMATAARSDSLGLVLRGLSLDKSFLAN